MQVLLDPKAVALRDAFSMLFWASLVAAFSSRGPAALLGLAAYVVIARGLGRLGAATTDPAYLRRLGFAKATAYAAAPMAFLSGAIGRLLDGGRGTAVLWLFVAPALVELVHKLAVIAAMSRLADVWGEDALRRRWYRVRGLTVAAAVAFAAFGVGVYAAVARGPRFDRDSSLAFFLPLIVGLLVTLAAWVLYLVAIWQMRAVAARAAQVPVPAPA
jgi:hypothetical protein